MPAGALVTLPTPVPAVLTVRLKFVAVAPDRAKATPRKALFVPAVAMVVSEAPAEPVSLTVTSLLALSAVVAHKTGCREPLTHIVTPPRRVASPRVQVRE